MSLTEFKLIKIPALIIISLFSLRDERRERIVAECNSVRQALQELLSEYMDNAGKRPSPQLDGAIGEFADLVEFVQNLVTKR